MKKISLLTLIILLLVTVILFLSVYDQPAILVKVWSQMLAGRPFNLPVFTLEWVICFNLLIYVWLKQFSLTEKLYVDAWVNKTLLAISQPNLTGNHPLHKIPAEAEVLPEKTGITEVEAGRFRQLLKEEEGPSILQNNEWEQSFDELMNGGVTSAGGKEPGWMVMDLEEAGKEITDTGGGILGRNIDDLLYEQDQVFSLPEPFILKAATESSPGSEEYQDEEEGDDTPVLKVVFRSETREPEDRIPSSMRKAWMLKEDKDFYNSFLDTCEG